MQRLGAPRPRGRAPLGSTRQVGLASTEVLSSWPFRRSLTPPWACESFRVSRGQGKGRAGLVGPQEGQWVGDERGGGGGRGAFKAFS